MDSSFCAVDVLLAFATCFWEMYSILTALFRVFFFFLHFIFIFLFVSSDVDEEQVIIFRMECS